MTADDLACSMTHGIAQKPGLGLDKFNYFENFEQAAKISKNDSHNTDIPKTLLSKIYDNAFGIQFFEYIFFRLILSISARQLGLLFDLIDLDHNGELSFSEFTRFITVLMKNSNASNALIEYRISNVDFKKSQLIKYLFDSRVNESKVAKQSLLDFQYSLLEDLTIRQVSKVCNISCSTSSVVTVRHLIKYFASQCGIDIDNRQIVEQLALSDEVVSNLDSTCVDISQIVLVKFLLLEIESLMFIFKAYEMMNTVIDSKVYKKLIGIHLKNSILPPGKANEELSDVIIEILFRIMDKNHDQTVSVDEAKFFFENLSFYPLHRDHFYFIRRASRNLLATIKSVLFFWN